MNRDLTRDRKLKAAMLAMLLVFLGLLACLLALWLAKGSEVAVGSLYTAFAAGTIAGAKLFFDANVKVHQVAPEPKP